MFVQIYKTFLFFEYSRVCDEVAVDEYEGDSEDGGGWRWKGDWKDNSELQETFKDEISKWSYKDSQQKHDGSINNS